MYEMISKNFMGSTITLALTGLPILITGEVVPTSATNIIGLRIEGGNKVYINTNLVAFFY
ncbi:MAG: hypothetical protein H7Y18_00015 [Clostridiaceae bacterium]|nr:hypothetical protein [Clostridiaceae bacterium]